MPGTLTHSPARIVRELVILLGQGTDPDDNGTWPVFADLLPDLPDSAIYVTTTTSLLQGREMVAGQVQEFYAVQIGVRAASPTTGWTKANAVGIALDGGNGYQRSVTIGANTYQIHAMDRRSGVIAAGKESPTSKRNLFTLNYITSIRQTA